MALHLSPGTKIKDYHVVKLLATGGEGTAYLATSKGKKVVLKQHSCSVSDPTHVVDAERTGRLECLIGKHHPNVCAILDLFIYKDLLHVVMEFIEGDTLDVLLTRTGPLSIETFQPILNTTLMALGWFDDLEIVHRDIKPSNIIITTNPKGHLDATLIDLCAALHRRLPRVTHKESCICTPEYAPPELILGGDADIDGRADLYGVGAVMFEALTGQMPFPDPPGDALFKAILDANRPSAREFVPEISEDVDEYIQRLMALHPKDRPATARQAWDEFTELLASVATGTPTSVKAVDPMPAPATPIPAPPAPVVPIASVKTPAGPAGLPCLLVNSGTLKGTTIHIPGTGVTLGRNVLNPDDTLISRFHCRAMAKRRHIVLRDLDSANGLIVGTRRVRKVRLSPGDAVCVGATNLQYV